MILTKIAFKFDIKLFNPQKDNWLYFFKQILKFYNFVIIFD